MGDVELGIVQDTTPAGAGGKEGELDDVAWPGHDDAASRPIASARSDLAAGTASGFRDSIHSDNSSRGSDRRLLSVPGSTRAQADDMV